MTSPLRRTSAPLSINSGKPFDPKKELDRAKELFKTTAYTTALPIIKKLSELAGPNADRYVKASADDMLGDMYSNNLGVKAHADNEKLAVQHYLLAADQWKNVWIRMKASEKVARAYLEGKGIKKDLEQAEIYLNRAVKTNRASDGIQEELDDLRKKINSKMKKKKVTKLTTASSSSPAPSSSSSSRAPASTRAIPTTDASTLLKLAEEHFANEDYKAAFPLYLQLSKQTSPRLDVYSMAKVNFALGDMYAKNQGMAPNPTNKQKSLEHFLLVTEQSKSQWMRLKAAAKVAHAYVESRDFTQAEIYIDLAERLHPNDTTASEMKALRLKIHAEKEKTRTATNLTSASSSSSPLVPSDTKESRKRKITNITSASPAPTVSSSSQIDDDRTLKTIKNDIFNRHYGEVLRKALPIIQRAEKGESTLGADPIAYLKSTIARYYYNGLAGLGQSEANKREGIRLWREVAESNTAESAKAIDELTKIGEWKENEPKRQKQEKAEESNASKEIHDGLAPSSPLLLSLPSGMRENIQDSSSSSSPFPVSVTPQPQHDHSAHSKITIKGTLEDFGMMGTPSKHILLIQRARLSEQLEDGESAVKDWRKLKETANSHALKVMSSLHLKDSDVNMISLPSTSTREDMLVQRALLSERLGDPQEAATDWNRALNTNDPALKFMVSMHLNENYKPKEG
jgi:tetratricopeptide (TPR) repeat protein